MCPKCTKTGEILGEICDHMYGLISFIALSISVIVMSSCRFKKIAMSNVTIF